MNLVQDTLLLTKQNHRIDKKKINLTALIQNILQSSGPQINEKSLHLESQIEEITFKTNEPMVHSIFENLIENAINTLQQMDKFLSAYILNKIKLSSV